MTLMGNKFKRCVYSIEIRDQTKNYLEFEKNNWIRKKDTHKDIRKNL